jgi:hypothetical protein
MSATVLFGVVGTCWPFAERFINNGRNEKLQQRFASGRGHIQFGQSRDWIAMVDAKIWRRRSSSISLMNLRRAFRFPKPKGGSGFPARLFAILP